MLFYDAMQHLDLGVESPAFQKKSKLQRCIYDNAIGNYQSKLITGGYSSIIINKCKAFELYSRIIINTFISIDSILFSITLLD